ncbi:hypothetical protein BKA70DRAFT_1286716 [Coprinopsis sp. MPI-PUGE-AT-0042]|nr:hypothetical protein BKA70DRAFT_1286716 [Coprinopsis sp. MPI-PUGE-AT-0042]
MLPVQSFTEYFSHNLPLPDELLPFWTSYLDRLSQLISKIDQKILDAAGSKGLKYLQKNRLEHCERRILVTSFRSAVRRLPAEIIAHIICLTLDVYRKPLTHTERQELMALRTHPAIWQSLEVNFTLRTWSATAVTSWFSRGGLGGLKHLSVKNSKWFSETPDVDQILKFIDHSPFLFSGLSFSLPTLSDIKVLARPSAARATVKILTLLLPCPPGGHDHRSVGTSKKSLKLGESFPRLASLVLRGHLQTHTPFTHPSLASLAFDEGHLTPSYFLRFSERFPSLQDLTVHRGTFLEYNDILELPSNHLKNLKRLTLGGFCIPYVLRAFDCPSIQWLLSHLSTVRNVWSNPPFPNDLESFLQRSQANDITLRITTEEHDLENLAWMLPAISYQNPYLSTDCMSRASIGLLLAPLHSKIRWEPFRYYRCLHSRECPDGETESIEDMLVRDNCISCHE